ncbi:hypothetical protein [Labilithrix luteola]|nr:hypothetical protein [Labilithrix luteola]
MLSEMSGTPLPRGDSWDAEARARLADFQRSEGLVSNGELNDATVARLRTRFEMLVEQRHPAGSETIVDQSPTAESHAQVVHVVQEALHNVEHVAEQFAHDAPIRARYISEARTFASNIVAAFERGELTVAEAALLASRFRNSFLNEARSGLSPAGAALSKFLKEEGLTLPALVEKYSGKLFQKGFKDLTEAERGAVLLQIAKKAGVTNPNVNVASRLAPAMGKALLAVSIAIAVYQVASAEDHVGEGIKQGASLLGFWAGAKLGAMGGAAVCGPGAPLCAVVGGLAGGILGAILAETAADAGYHWVKG